ncbi:MAG: ArnT family glycosyltransferase, partial [Anaerolineae bacterium]
PDLTTLPAADARTHSQADGAARAGAWATAHREATIIAAALVVFGWLLWTISPPPNIRPPLPVDLAFDSFVPLRRAMLAQAANSAPILIGIGAAGLTVLWALALRGRRIKPAISASIALGCVLLALQAQVYVMRQQQNAGVALYLFAGAVFGVWLLANRKTPNLETPPGLSRRAELILLTLVLAVTVFGRIYDLKRTPYGIDGDESKWTVEVVSVMVDGRDELGSEYHRRYLPMSFWMQAPFHWIVGPGLTSARLEVAIFSVIASFVFYRLVRELCDAPTALVATLLLAVSLPDLTASRVGNVESHVKLWAILPFYGLAVALRTRAPRHFLLTGFALAGAMLTYETLMPIVAATLTLALAAALRERREWKTWLRRLAMLATPPAVVAFVTIDYLLGRMQYYRDYRSQAEIYSFGEQLLRGIQGLLGSFSDRPTLDWLYYRDGPIINGLLAPLLALGLVYAIVHVRRRGSAIALTWLAWVFIPAPIILHSPLPRILYPGVPVL